MSEVREARMRVRVKGTDQTAIVHGAQLVSGFTRAMPTRGTRELLQAYGASPVLQSVVRKIATAVASTEWRAEVKLATGEWTAVPNHIGAAMLNSGVPGLDGMQCKMLEQQSIELVGDCFAVLDRNFLDAPYRRWPVPAHWVSDVPSPNGEFFEVRPPGGTPVKVHRRNMLWHKDVDPSNPYGRGIGVGRALTDELNADEAAAKHTGASLTNRARPDIIISGSKEIPLSKEDAERIHEIWQQRFGGPINAGKPFVSGGPINVNTLTPSFRELQLKDLREFERDIIITVFGIPPELVGILENSNRATIETAEFLFSKHVIRPRLVARASAYTDQLAPQYDDRIRFWFEDPVDEDKQFKREVIAARPRAFSDDEVRALAGEAPLPDGAGEWRDPDAPLPTGSADGDDDGDLAPAPVPTEDVQGTALNGAQIQALQQIAQAVADGQLPAETAIQVIVVAFPLIDEDTARAIIEPATTFEPASAEQTLAAQVMQRIRRARLAPRRRANGVHKITAAEIDEILAAIDERGVASVLTESTRSAIAEFGSDALERLDVAVAFDLQNPRVLSFIESAGVERSSLITGTTRKHLRAQLVEGIGAGENTRDLVKRIQSVVTNAVDHRAETISRTEIVRASNFATEEAHQQAGVTEKEWLATQDDRTRDSHSQMDGQRQPTGTAFVSPDGFEAMYPGDFGIAAEDINCRCAVIAVDSAPDKAARVQRWKAFEDQRERNERHLKRGLQAAFREQGEQAIRRLEELG